MFIPLTGGAYQARSVIASAQRCVNLYPEVNPQESQNPAPVTHYPTPGLRLLAQSPTVAPVRGTYLATNGDLYACIGTKLYFVANDWTFTLVGTVADRATPVSMADNGLVLVLVDGSSSGYAVNLASGLRQFGSISGAAFYGADRVGFLDTYFVFNRPGTNQFYISLSMADYAMLTGGAAFDALDIAAKAGSADPIVATVIKGREMWLIGSLTTEVWTNTGAADFTFGQIPGVFINHGCMAKYSVALHDVFAFWLAQDRDGGCVVVRTNGYMPERISTHAIEAEISGYAVKNDAIGYCYQQQGHAFYVLTFPTANKSWAFEMRTGQWHELASTDNNGGMNRHRANCIAYAYGENVVGDWQSGRLYALDPDEFTDDGRPIIRVRTFPHLVADGDRVIYSSFIADMQVGALGGTKTARAAEDDFSSDFSRSFGPLPPVKSEPMVSLRWSDTRGASWGNPVMQSLGSAGEYPTSIQFQRLGMARDRVFELSWSAPARTALNGAFISKKKNRT
jgi:hypothetical protein